VEVESPALEFLVARGHHERTTLYYIQPDHPSHDPIDKSFLYGPAADYVASYVSAYPQYFTSNVYTQARDQLIAKIKSALEVPASKWAHAYSPAEDLHVLASLPRPYLASLGSTSPHLSLPSRASNSDALNTLATIFHGPILVNTIMFPPRVDSTGTNGHDEAEVRAAGELYNSYVSRNTSFWTDVTTQADTIALVEPALAATNLIKAVVTAPWDGIKAINTMPTRSAVVPWLLAPPKTFSNLVGGHGDAESAAYKIATARFDALKAFYTRAKDKQGDEYRIVTQAAKERIAEGIWGGRRGEIGGRIGTMDL